MITINKFMEAVAMYVDKEFVDKIPGLAKWAIGLASSGLIAKIPGMIEEHQEMLMSMGYLSADNMIMIDKVYNDMIMQAREKGDVVQTIPLVGDVRFSSQDIETFYKMCK